MSKRGKPPPGVAGGATLLPLDGTELAMSIHRSHHLSSSSALHRTRLTRSPMLIALAIAPYCTPLPPPAISRRSQIAGRGAVTVALAPAIKLLEPTAFVQIPIARRYR
jgi:hypothetical protein